jgi:hypothetical protein
MGREYKEALMAEYPFFLRDTCKESMFVLVLVATILGVLILEYNISQLVTIRTRALQGTSVSTRVLNISTRVPTSELR